MTSVVETIKKRKIAITDIKGAYLNAKKKDEVLMKTKGEEGKLFCELDTSLEQFFTKEKNFYYIKFYTILLINKYSLKVLYPRECMRSTNILLIKFS